MSEEAIEGMVLEPSKPPLSLRERILALDDRLYEEVVVPEWAEVLGDEPLRVRGMTGSERDRWEGEMVRFSPDGRRRQMDFSDLRAKLVARCVVDEDGKRIFTDRDIGALGGKSASALQRLFEVAQRLSRLTDEDVEELTGESKGDPSSANGSGSPVSSVSP